MFTFKLLELLIRLFRLVRIDSFNLHFLLFAPSHSQEEKREYFSDAIMALPRQLTVLLSFLLVSLFPILSLCEAKDEGVLNAEIGRLNNQSLLWGPYRPNLYFGVRPRIPKSVTTGLLWAKVDNYVDVQNSKNKTPDALYLANAIFHS